jgi:hypothetical protein
VRVHSATSFKPLAVLDLHKESVYTVAFAPLSIEAEEEHEVSEEEEETDNGSRVRAWLASGGKDERISLWEIYPVTNSRSRPRDNT